MNGKHGVPLTRQLIWDEFNKIMSTPIEQPGAATVYQPWLETDHHLPDLGERTTLQELVQRITDRNLKRQVTVPPDLTGQQTDTKENTGQTFPWGKSCPDE